MKRVCHSFCTLAFLALAPLAGAAPGPIRLANRMAANQASPLNGDMRHRYASTGGWALAFNAFWFPDNYLHTALYVKAVKGVEWRDVDARTVMSAALSSASGWRANVVRELGARGILPRQEGPDCSA